MTRSLHQCVLLGNCTSISMTTTAFFFLVTFFAVVSLVSFLCAIHERSKSRRPQNDQKLATSISNISNKAVRMVKMISWKREAVEDEEAAVWKKTILMGERCRPLDFSGRILYDSEGHQLMLLDSPKTARMATTSGSTAMHGDQ